ncbi:MAG: quinate 5-dehydrogenase [Actinobacteria bacterium]|nr:quinate 5-dehydrogenase [Actinomycetota bacterium]
MKNVISISIGSPKRNHSTAARFGGHEFNISRIGTDGDIKKALELYKEYDGKVDAIGVGGMELFFRVGDRRYFVKDAKPIREIVKKSILADGNGIKPTLTRNAVTEMLKAGIELKGERALITSAVDRYCEAEEFAKAGCETIFGDFIFALGINIPLRKIRTVKILAAILLPILTKMPFSFLYPTGSEQEKEPSEKYAKYYKWADIIVGDFLFIRKYLLNDMSGKIIFTNTTTKQDVEDLWRRGLDILVTTTPEFEGRTFGTNVMEAVVLSLLGKKADEASDDDYARIINEIGMRPRIMRNPYTGKI